MRFNVKRLFFFLLSVLWAVSLQAASVPELFNYQGRLLDEDGTPLSGSREAVFGIYEAPAGGTALWEQKTTVVTDTNGLFNATLGGTTNSLLAAVGNRFDALYLDMAFKVGGVMEPVRPRPQFVSVPYAKLAENMAGAQSLDVTSNLTVGQKSMLKTLSTDTAVLEILKSPQITSPKVQVSSIQPTNPARSNVVRVASPAVFHGFSAKGSVIIPSTSKSDLPLDAINSWSQATTDQWVSFSGNSTDYSACFVFKMSATRPDLAPSQYGNSDSRVTAFATVLKKGPQGLCVPVPAGWWFGYYAYVSSGSYLSGTYRLSDKFTDVKFYWIQGL